MIRRTLLVLAAALLSPGLAPLPVRAAGATEATIAGLEQACNDAYARNDLAPYFGCYRDTAVLIFYDYRTTMTEYRKTWTESVHVGNVVTAFRLSDLVIRVAPAGDVAVASYRVDAANHYADGHDTAEQGFETDVWVKRSGAWKIEHAQYSLALPPPG
jgi:ketosteroid isomerase-like protein